MSNMISVEAQKTWLKNLQLSGDTQEEINRWLCIRALEVAEGLCNQREREDQGTEDPYDYLIRLMSQQ